MKYGGVDVLELARRARESGAPVDCIVPGPTYDEVLDVVAAKTGWLRGTWSSGSPCLRKPCGRVASDFEVEAVMKTLFEEAAARGGVVPELEA